MEIVVEELAHVEMLDYVLHWFESIWIGLEKEQE